MLRREGKLYVCPRGCFSESPFACSHQSGTGEIGKSLGNPGNEIVLILEDDDSSKADDRLERFRDYYEIEDRNLRERSAREVKEKEDREEEADRIRRIPSYALMCPKTMRVGPGYNLKLVRVEGWQ